MPMPEGATIAKISLFKKRLLGFTADDDGKKMRKYVAFAINNILGSTVPFCRQDGDKLRGAVIYLEEREPRLAVCGFSWGACALLSRGLMHRRPRRPRRVRARARDGAASTAAVNGGRTEAGGGSGTTEGDSEVPPADVTEEQRLAQEQLDFLNQLE